MAPMVVLMVSCASLSDGGGSLCLPSWWRWFFVAPMVVLMVLCDYHAGISEYLRLSLVVLVVL